MPRNGKPENLVPMNRRTKEEQREIAKKGGQASGAARRRKRDAKSAAKLILNLPALNNIEQNLKALGIEDERDYTNLVAIMARAFDKGMTGDINAMRFLVEMANITPSQQLTEKQYKDKMNKPVSEKEEAFKKLEEVLDEIFDKGGDS